jgi:uncharacterized protein with HEPN domain
MGPRKADAAYLWDMLDAAKAVLSFTAGMEYDHYISDRKTQLAVERAIEIIGEAARYVSESCKESHPEIPWGKIIRQRHVLAHEYGEIRHERIWALIEKYIPELIGRLEPLVPPPPVEV